MGLRFTDLESWQRWQDSRRRLHVFKDRLRGRTDSPLELTWWIRGTAPTLLVACDSNSPTNHHSLLAPLGSSTDAIVVTPAGMKLDLPSEGWLPLADPTSTLDSITTMASIGDHLRVGQHAHELARERGWRQFVVQHGILTPFSPPPPPSTTLLAWSGADAHYLREGRPDLSAEVVGSPMLSSAAERPATHVSRFETPVFLGQLHGAELSRWSMTRSVTAFWRRTGATYRPHPREEDKLSRLQHAAWSRMGMDFDRTGSLAELDRPVVAAFSTGVLEAAARGIPAWVFHLDPPEWLREVWGRYGMREWGETPTEPPAALDTPQTILQAIQN